MERKITRERFIEESLKLFQEKGFKATTMRDIAQRLNIEAATIYNYIDSKQALLETLLFEIADKFQNGVQHISSSSYAPVDKIKALINLNVRLTTEYPYHVSLLVSDWKHLKEPRKTDFIENRASYEDKVRGMVKEGIDIGALRKMDPEIATFSILSAIRWLFSWYTSKQPAINPIELEKQIIDFVLKGVEEGSNMP